MSTNLSIINKNEVIDLLKAINKDFGFSLDKRVNIENYTEKILEKAYCLGQYEKGSLISIIAVYCNNTKTREGYLTLLGVAKPFRGKGIAKNLLISIIKHLTEMNFNYLSLQTSNTTALQLYLNQGFRIEKTEINFSGGKAYYLSKELL